MIRLISLIYLVLGALVVVPQAAFAQSEIDQLRSENARLREQVAALEAQLADQTIAACLPQGGTTANDRGTVALLRKLGAQRDSAARAMLGQGGVPLVVPDDLLGAFVPNEYIVLTDGFGDVAGGAAAVAARFGLDVSQIVHVYGRAVPGFTARMDAATRDRIETLGPVRAIVRNGYVFAAGSAVSPVTPTGPRQRITPVQAQGGNLVDVYLFDTGIRGGHADLDGRVSADGFSSFDNGIAGEDCSGHGTHVAARIAGHLLGVTDKARLTSVKVIDRFGAGDVGTVIAGIDWVLSRPAPVKLVNMSLTRRVTQKISPLDMAIEALLGAGAIVVVAAGNAAADAGDFTPARVDGVITVGSVDGTDLSDFSNAGQSVDIYAPGEKVMSASIRDVCSVREMSGTSMAAPYVTGLIAEVLSTGVPPQAAVGAVFAGATTVRTGAYEGERRRRILVPANDQAEAALCKGLRRVTYDDGFDLPAR